MRSLLQYRGYCTFVSLLVLLCANNSQQTPQEEVDFLVQLFTNCDGTNWPDSSTWNTFWTGSNSVCDWEGIVCDESFHVTALALPRKNLAGCQIPVTVSNLTRLTTLDLSHNRILGPLPNTLWTLTLLKTLSLSKNMELEHSFTNLTDMSELHSLEQFKMNDMKLSGHIPASLFRIGTLKYVYLQNNRLTSLSWGDSSRLEQIVDLNVRNNSIDSLPDQVARLVNCELLDMSYNQMADFLPIGLTQMVNADEIYLNNNQLAGNLHDFTVLKKLAQMDLSVNKLFGALPPWLPNVTFTLNLGNNSFDCPLPSFAEQFQVVDCVDRANLPMIFIFVALGAVVVVVIIGGIIYTVRRNRKISKKAASAAASLIVGEDVAYTKLEEDPIGNRNEEKRETALEPEI
jgi:Leucine-rich repeat (LRR) protein